MRMAKAFEIIQGEEKLFPSGGDTLPPRDNVVNIGCDGWPASFTLALFTTRIASELPGSCAEPPRRLEKLFGVFQFGRFPSLDGASLMRVKCL